jgi:ligand-binding sensor domain-containing protein
VFEDSRGDIWIASFVPAREVVTRWERRTASFHHYSEADGLRPFASVVSFCEDAAGGVWMGFRDGGLARYRAGSFTLLGPDEGLPTGGINSIYLDGSGRLWLAALRGGLCRIDNTEAARPRVVTYTTAEGLKTNLVQYVTGDLAGRIGALSITRRRTV